MKCALNRRSQWVPKWEKVGKKKVFVGVFRYRSGSTLLRSFGVFHEGELREGDTIMMA